MNNHWQHDGICASIFVNNVDTDQIIPSREMNRVSKQGLGEGLFAGWRYVYDGMKKVGLRDDFVLNQPAHKNTSILLAGKNFGCGSSREHAVWALRDYGITVIIAESFGGIFRINCAHNGLLAISLDGETIDQIHRQTQLSPQDNRLFVDLVARSIQLPDGEKITFGVNESDRFMLLQGMSYIDYTMQYQREIQDFIRADRDARPWAHL